jgi:hypothetical protein
MKLPPGTQKWGVAVLGVVSLLLVINLVAQYREMEPGHSHAHPVKASGPVARVKAPSHTTDDLAKYDPGIHLAALKALDSRPLPDEERNPFEFVGGPPPPIPQMNAAAPGAPNVAPAPPPPPPPPPLKAAGYNELPGGQKEAMVTYNDDMVVVHEGDLIGTKFKVVKITPTMVVVQDGDTHQSLELPFPQ